MPLPYTVEYFAVGEDANVDVGHDDVMKMALALVGEEEIGHPDLIRIRQCQVLQFTCDRYSRSVYIYLYINIPSRQ